MSEEKSVPFCVLHFKSSSPYYCNEPFTSISDHFLYGSFRSWQWAQTGHSFQSVLTAMQGLQLSYPPAQFNFQITFGLDSVVPIERLFRFFALESLVLDPGRTLFPLQVPRDLEVDVTPSQWRKYKPDWESAFNEDYEYIVFLPEGLYAQVYTHMTRAFPDHIVQCHGDGRVAKVDVRVKPMAFSDLADALYQVQSEVDSLHAEVAQMRRCQELLFHNLATITKDWMEVNPELADRLHPSTPQSWIVSRSEED